MNPQDILDYLSRHPDFFTQHPAILADIEVPHPHGGQAISLTERQLLALREKLAQVQGKLAELISFGEENDVITTRIHRMSLALLDARSLASVRATACNHLQEDFSVPHVGLHLWNASGFSDALPSVTEDSEELRFYAAGLAHPYCGAAHNAEVIAWFKDAGAGLRSMALVPLRRDGQAIGLLALASEDAERFFPEMGTLYLSRIGELVSAALCRHLD